jgi:hypothetical protein
VKHGHETLENRVLLGRTGRHDAGYSGKHLIRGVNALEIDDLDSVAEVVLQLSGDGECNPGLADAGRADKGEKAHLIIQQGVFDSLKLPLAVDERGWLHLPTATEHE